MNANPYKQADESGFTLVELLVVLAISGIVSAAIFASYLSQERVYQNQQLIAEMQQNARSAMLIASRETRMINAYLGSDGLGWWDSMANAGQERKFFQGFRAHNDYDGGTDAIDIAYADFQVSTPLRDSMPQSSAELKVVSVDGFEEGMFAIISDGDSSDLMEITQVQGAAAQKLQHNPAAASGLNSPNGLNKAYQAGAMVFVARFVSFRILLDDPDHPKLGMALNYAPGSDPADRIYFELAEDIEDLQMAYVFDDGDTADAPNDADLDDTNDYDDVSAIRVSIVARTRSRLRGMAGAAPMDVEDHDTPDAPDGYHRRLLSEEIRVRNLNLNS